MTISKIYCSLCDKEYKVQHSAFIQDLHIRRYHMDMLVRDAVKKYMKDVTGVGR